jgi:hypothetical protein
MNIYTLPTALSVEIFDRYNVNKKLFFRHDIFIKELLFSTNRISLIIPFLLISLFSSAQSNYPYTVNVAGNQVTKGNYNIEWSVGESAAINTMDKSSLIVVTNGLLQYNVENQPETNLVPSFLSNEVRVYPNPVKNELYINILHASKGNDQIELLDAKGVKLKEKVVIYNGMGALENWNLSGLKAGQYFLNVRHTHPVTGKLIKKGAYKILKVN